MQPLSEKEGVVHLKHTMTKPAGGFLYYFTLSMTAIYALLGLYIMFSDIADNFLVGNKRYILGVLLIFYSFFRAFRIWKINKNMHSDNE
jgi:hypothetical protein